MADAQNPPENEPGFRRESHTLGRALRRRCTIPALKYESSPVPIERVRLRVKPQRSIMSSLVVALIVFVCVFGCGMLGLALRSFLPDHHLSEDSTVIVKLGAGLMATLAALVLGLLIASAKVSFDRLNDEFMQTAATVIMIDRTLADYGPV